MSRQEKLTELCTDLKDVCNVHMKLLSDGGMDSNELYHFIKDGVLLFSASMLGAIGNNLDGKQQVPGFIEDSCRVFEGFMKKLQERLLENLDE